jgi:integrase
MGRKLKGPIKRSDSQLYWARLTVKLSERPQAGCRELWRSLQTSDLQLACSRWPEAMQELRRQLAERLSPVPLRELVEGNQGSTFLTDDSEPTAPLDPRELTQILLGKDSTQAMRHVVYESLSNNTALPISWNELVDVHLQLKNRKRGEPLSKSTLFSIRKAVEIIEPYCKYPDHLTKDSIRQVLSDLRNANEFSDRTIQQRLSLLQAIIQSGLKEDVLTLTTNPFTLVDFTVSSRSEDSYRSFTDAELIELFKTTKHPLIWETLLTTGLRIGELVSRTTDHIDKGILIVSATDNWRPKTKASYRRVPINHRCSNWLSKSLPFNNTETSVKKALASEIRLISSDPKLVVHSCRHTWKTWSRAVGMPATISDELSGHAKASVSRVSDQYGHYPDTILIEEQAKVWRHFDQLMKR